jgi:tetratricopeptide (TPR) repeat protein
MSSVHKKCKSINIYKIIHIFYPPSGQDTRITGRYGMGWTYRYEKGVPIEAQYLFRKAMEMYHLGKTESALKYLRQTVVIAPCYSKALFTMGTCLDELGLHDEASARYDQAIRIEPALKDIRDRRS